MLTNLDPESALFVTQLDRLQQRIADASNQVSSGKKITTASDAPDQISALLQLRADLQQNSQVKSNLTLATTQAGAADSALSSAIQLMDTALTLAAQGANTTVDANERLSLAQQVRDIQQQMVSYSQTSVEGSYIFSGDADSAPAYSYDSAAVNPVVQLSSASATRVIQNPAGGSFQASQTAQNIFDTRDSTIGLATADNVFQSLNNLLQALQNNDATGVSDSITDLKQASQHLNSMEAFYGDVEGRIQSASDFASQYDTQLQTQISQTEDADVTSAAMELSQANTQLQAAFEAHAQIPRKSLFDYLG